MRMRLEIPVMTGAALLVLALAVAVGQEQRPGAPPSNNPGAMTKSRMVMPPVAKPIALVGGRVRTMSDLGVIDNGVVIIRNGLIEAVGPASTVKPPEDAEVITVPGLTVAPGLIDSKGALWLDPNERREQAGDASLNLVDGLNPYQTDWQELARQGITSVYIMPGGFCGGPGLLTRVGPSFRGLPDSVVIQAQTAIPVSTEGGNAVARFDAVNRVKSLLDSAKTYGDAFKKYEEEKKKAEEAKKKGVPEKKGDEKKPDEKKPESNPNPGPNPNPGDGARPFPFPRDGRGLRKMDDRTREEFLKKIQEMRAEMDRNRGGSSTSTGPKAPTKDFGKDMLLKVVNKEIPLRVELQNDDAVPHLLKLAEDYKIKLVLEGLTKINNQATILAQRGLPLVLGPFHSDENRNNQAKQWPQSLLPKDAVFAIGTYSDQPFGSRTLRLQASQAVALGIGSDQAFAAITSNAAKVLGVSDKVGSITPGKRADIAVFAGDPLDASTSVRLTVSAGTITYRDDSIKSASSFEIASPDAIEKRLPNRLPAKYLVKSTRILFEDGEWTAGKFVVDQGKFTTIAKDTNSIAGVPEFDLGSLPVTPSLVSLSADARLVGPSEFGEADSSWVKVSDSFDPAPDAVNSLVQSGFLTLALAPGSSNFLAGGAACARLGSPDPIFSDLIAEKIVLSPSSRNRERYPSSLPGQVEFLENTLDNQPHPISLRLPEAVRKQLELERSLRMSSVGRAERLVLIEVHSQSDVKAALRLIENRKLKATLVGGLDVAPFVNDLKRLNVGLMVTPIRLGETETSSDYDREIKALAQAGANGVAIAFTEQPGKPLQPNELRATAAFLVNSGLPQATALRGLTSTAARLTGMPDLVGKLATGAPADFIVWTGSPLDLRSRLVRAVVDGRVLSQKGQSRP